MLLNPFLEKIPCMTIFAIKIGTDLDSFNPVDTKKLIIFSICERRGYRISSPETLFQTSMAASEFSCANRNAFNAPTDVPENTEIFSEMPYSSNAFQTPA